MKYVLWTVLLTALVGCATGNRPLQLLSGAGPVYPAQARADGVEGIVTVQYDVNVEGRVINARVVSSNPPEIFDAAALEAVRSWRFNAPRRDGQPIPARDRQSTVTFQLAGSDKYDSY